MLKKVRKRQRRMVAMMAALLALSVVFTSFTAFAEADPDALPETEHSEASPDGAQGEPGPQTPAQEEPDPNGAVSQPEPKTDPADGQEEIPTDGAGEGGEPGPEDDAASDGDPEDADGEGEGEDGQEPEMVTVTFDEQALAQVTWMELTVTHGEGEALTALSDGDRVPVGTELTITAELTVPGMPMMPVMVGEQRFVSAQSPYVFGYTVSADTQIGYGSLVAPMASIGGVYTLPADAATLRSFDTSLGHSVTSNLTITLTADVTTSDVPLAIWTSIFSSAASNSNRSITIKGDGNGVWSLPLPNITTNNVFNFQDLSLTNIASIGGTGNKTLNNVTLGNNVPVSGATISITETSNVGAVQSTNTISLENSGVGTITTTNATSITVLGDVSAASIVNNGTSNTSVSITTGNTLALDLAPTDSARLTFTGGGKLEVGSSVSYSFSTSNYLNISNITLDAGTNGLTLSTTGVTGRTSSNTHLLTSSGAVNLTNTTVGSITASGGGSVTLTTNSSATDIETTGATGTVSLTDSSANNITTKTSGAVVTLSGSSVSGTISTSNSMVSTTGTGGSSIGTITTNGGAVNLVVHDDSVGTGGIATNSASGGGNVTLGTSGGGQTVTVGGSINTGSISGSGDVTLHANSLVSGSVTAGGTVTVNEASYVSTDITSHFSSIGPPYAVVINQSGASIRPASNITAAGGTVQILNQSAGTIDSVTAAELLVESGANANITSVSAGTLTVDSNADTVRMTTVRGTGGNIDIAKGEYDYLFLGGNSAMHTLSGGTFDYIWLAAHSDVSSAWTSGSSTLTISGPITVSGTIFGGGYGLDTSISPGIIQINSALDLSNHASGGIFAGGNGNYRGPGATIHVNAAFTGNVYLGGYGGSAGTYSTKHAGTVNSSAFELTSGSVSGSVYGGEYTDDGTSGNVKQASITLTNGIINGSVFGGGEDGGAVDSVTINVGDDAVNGNIYAGGHGGDTTVGDAAITTTANLSTGTTNIYGAGYAGNVTGKTEIKIDAGYGASAIYAGGYDGSQTGSGSGGSYITVSNAAVTADIYGGSENNGTVEYASITTDAGVTGSIYGGGQGAGNVEEVVILHRSGTVNGSIYGGGNTGSSAVNKATITNNDMVSKSIFGGGSNSGKVDDVTIVNNGSVTNYIYGGGNGSGDVGDVLITNNGTVSQNIYGGSHSSTGSSVTGSAEIISNGTVTGNIYGGHHLSTADKSVAKVKITVNSSSSSDTVNNVYGGNHGGSAGTVGEAEIHLGTTGMAYIQNDVFGGSDSTAAIGVPKAVIHVDANGASVTGASAIYGGSDGGDTDVGEVAIHIQGPVGAGQDVVFGGSKLGGNTPKVTIAVNGGGNVNGNVHGGSLGSNSIGTISTVQIDVGNSGTGNTVSGDVYGGSKPSGPSDGRVVDSAVVNIGVADGALNTATVGGTVWGGGEDAVVDITNVTVHSGSIGADIYGGGGSTAAAEVTGSTIVEVNGANIDIGGTVYGGGENAKVDGSATVRVSNHTITANKVNSIYGGGHASTALADAGVASTTVNLNNLSLTNGSEIFGGGTTSGAGMSSGSATVAGTATVNVSGGTLTLNGGSLYGGGEHDGNTVNDTSVVIAGAVNGGNTDNVYGGGKNSGATVLNNTAVNVNSGGNVQRDVYGGGLNSAAVVNNTAVNINSSGTVQRNVYGGGLNGAAVGGETRVTVAGGGTVQTNLYGGGNNGSAVHSGSTTDAVAFVLIQANGAVSGSAHGGGRDASPVNGSTTVENHGSSGFLYGGGEDSIVHANTTVLSDGSVTRDVFGGGHTVTASVPSTVGGSSNVTISDGRVGNIATGGDVFGGGRNTDADVTGATFVRVSGGTVRGHVFGGGLNGAQSNANVNVYISGGTVGELVSSALVGGDVYGGGTDYSTNETGGTPSPVNANTNVYVNNSGHVLGTVYGGGYHSDVSGNAVVGIQSGTVDQDVYGGGRRDTAPSTASRVKGNTTVTVDQGGYVGGTVYGGGLRSDTDINDTAGSTVRIYGSVNDVYGGGNQADVSYTGGIYGTSVTIYSNGLVRRDVHGGGLMGEVPGNRGTNVTVQSGASVGRSLYGGGDGTSAMTSGNVTGSSGTTVLVQGKVGTAVASDSDIRASHGSVFGGGSYGNVNYATNVTVTGSGATVTNEVYGGGYQGDVGANVPASGNSTNVVVDSSANVGYGVFGGGHGGGSSGGTNNYTPSSRNRGDVTGNTSVSISGANTIIGNPGKVGRDALGNTNTGFTGHDQNTNDGWAQYGYIFGGSNNAAVSGNSSVVISDLRQIAFARISGGNRHVEGPAGAGLTGTPVRYIELNRLGIGDYKNRGDYGIDDVSTYTVIRHLQDYTYGQATNCFLTVYYNLNSTDNGSDHDHGSGVDATADSNELHMSNGIYHPWRPYPHMVIRVEPRVFMDGNSRLRMRHDYTVNFVDGIEGVPANRLIPVMIDRVAESDAVTNKVYGPDVTAGTSYAVNVNIWDYSLLPDTVSPTNLLARSGGNIVGVNFYIPPTDVRNTGGNNTNGGGSSSRDRGSGSSGGGGGGGGGLGLSISASTGSAVAADPTNIMVDTGVLLSGVDAAVRSVSSGQTATVREQQADRITGDILRSAQQRATSAGGSVLLYFDTMLGSQVEGRMYLNPALASQVNGTILTRVYTRSDKVAATRNLFAKYYANKIAVVALAQQGSFGMEVRVASHVDLTGLNTQNLLFYAYNATTNAYTRIENPRYYFDSNGYLHFHTSIGGGIVITDQPLIRK